MKTFSISATGLQMTIDGDTAKIHNGHSGSYAKTYGFHPANGDMVLEIHGNTATLHNAPGGTMFGLATELAEIFNGG